MTDFVRARSEEQKQARMAEIKAAPDQLFLCPLSGDHPLHHCRKAVLDAGKPL